MHADIAANINEASVTRYGRDKTDYYSTFGTVSNSTLDLLYDFYRPFNVKLAKMLGRSEFDWKR